MTAKQEQNDLTVGVVWKKLLSFFFPVLFGLLFQQLYNTADAFIVGRWVGDNALAAVGGSVSSIVNLIIGFFTGLNVGATVIISQKFGAGDKEGLSRVLHTSVVFCFISGIFITALGILITPWALRFLGNPEDIMADSVRYLRIYFLGATPQLLYSLIEGVLRGVGDSRRPLRYLVISCLLNIGLDLLFVAVFGWGIAGAAWATIICMTVCMILALTHLLRTKEVHRLELRRLSLSRDVLARTMRIGIPSAVQGSMYSISNMIIQSSVNAFGTAYVTAWTATGKLDGFYWVTSNSFGIALCAFVGQCYGAGKLDRMKKAIRQCTVMSLGTTVCFSALILWVASAAFGLFLSDSSVIQLAVDVMWRIVPFYFIWSFIEILSGTYRGVGDTLKPMIIVLCGTCIFRILCIIFLLPLWHDFNFIGWLYTVSWAITATVYIIYYKKGHWMRYGETFN